MNTALKSRAVSAALLVSFGLAGCSATPDTVAYEADYPVYSSIAELCATASAVVVGQAVSSEVKEVSIVADTGGDEQTDPSLGAPGGKAEDASFKMVKTVSKFRVDAVLTGSGVSVGGVIDVGELGGELGGVKYSADQFGVANKRESVLFLKLADGVPASLLNPSQGGLTVATDGATASARSGSGLSPSAVSVDSQCGPA